MRPHNWPQKARVALSILLVGGLVVSMVVTGVGAHDEATLDVSVTVEDTAPVVESDTGGLPSLWNATVTLSNDGDRAVTVGVWVYSELQKAYAIWPVNGTDRTLTLQPGETQTVRVEAPNYDASLRVPEDGLYASWTVLTSDGRQRANTIHEVTRNAS